MVQVQFFLQKYLRSEKKNILGASSVAPIYIYTWHVLQVSSDLKYVFYVDMALPVTIQILKSEKKKRPAILILLERKKIFQFQYLYHINSTKD